MSTEKPKTAESKVEKVNSEKKIVPEPKVVEKEKSEKKEVEPIISSYNGGKNEKYTWSQ